VCPWVCFDQGQKLATINGSGMYASFNITVLIIDSNTAYSADVCTLLEVVRVQCYEHVICVAVLKHIGTASLGSVYDRFLEFSHKT
jgi:hypothetical protein